MGYPIQYQWTLLKGINDGQDELDGLLRLLKGKYALLNLIPFNGLEGEDYQRPDGARIVEMVHYLHGRGVLQGAQQRRPGRGRRLRPGLRARAVGLVNTRRLRAPAAEGA